MRLCILNWFVRGLNGADRPLTSTDSNHQLLRRTIFSQRQLTCVLSIIIFQYTYRCNKYPILPKAKWIKCIYNISHVLNFLLCPGYLCLLYCRAETLQYIYFVSYYFDYLCLSLVFSIITNNVCNLTGLTISKHVGRPARCQCFTRLLCVNIGGSSSASILNRF